MSDAKSLREKLEELKTYKNRLNKDTILEFNILLDSIKKELPEEYLIKFNSLVLYTEEKEYDYGELPF